MINYYLLKISGKSLNSFINQLRKNKVDIECIKYKKEFIIIKVSYESYKKIKEIKTINRIDIIRISGHRNIISIFYKYKVSILIFVISIFLIIFLSNLTMYINVETNNSVLERNIKKSLRDNNIKLFNINRTYKKLIEIKSIIKKDNLDRIEWLEIEQNGVILDVKVIERKDEKLKESTEYKDIVAKRNGYIRKIYAEKGELLKNIDDYVKKGDVIISGNIFRNNEVVGKTKASGKVYAEVWYLVKEEKSTKHNILKEKKGSISLNLKTNGSSIKLLSIPKKIERETLIVLFKTDLFMLSIDENKKYRIVNNNYTKEELKNVLETKAKKEIEKVLDNEEYIISQKTLKTEYKNGRMYIEVFFKVYEDIAEEKDLAQIEKKEDE